MDGAAGSVATADDGAKTGSPFGPLRNRNARNYLVTLSISSIGTWLQITALALVVYRLTGRATNLGLMTAAGMGPTLVLGAWAGGFVDRHDRRHVVIMTQSALTASAAVIGVLDLAGTVRMWNVYLIAFVTGVSAAFDNSARRGLVVEIVDPPDVAAGLALSTGAMMGGRVFGPGLAALMVTTVGTGWCFLLNAASFLGVLIALMRMDPAELHRAPLAIKGGRPVREGLKATWDDPVLRIALSVTVGVSMFAFNHQVAFPPLATHRWGGERSFGWVLSMSGVGAILGSLVTARQRRIGLRWHLTDIALLGLTLLGLSWAPNLGFALVLAVPFGATSATFYAGASAIAQDRADPTMRNRIFALVTVAFNGTLLIGGPLTGFVGDHFGIGWALAYAGILVLGACLAGVGAVRRAARSGLALPL